MAQQFVTNGGAAPTATGANASAGGSGASAPGAGAVAVGANTTANSSTNGQQVIDFRTAGQPNAQIVNAAAGTTSTTPSGTAIGQLSNTGTGGGVALGYNNSASNAGFFSTAIGANNLASGGYSTAIGDNNQATSTGAIALGVNNQATGLRSIAIGRQSYATGDLSIAQGFVASGYGANSVAIGANSVAGVAGTAAITNDVALGSAATATAGNSVALGAGSAANRIGLAGAAEAFSNTAVASTQGAVSVGAVGAERQIINVAGGTQNTDAVNVRQLRAAGNSLAASLGGGAQFDPTTNAYVAPNFTVNGTNYNNVGAAITALGTGGGTGVFASDNTAGAPAPVATGANSSAGGYGASATGANSTVVGNGATDAGNGGTVAVGRNATTNASNSVAIGNGATTLGNNGVASVAIGNTAIAGGDGAVGIGLLANANGTGAVAAGNRSAATGDSAVAFGDLATATGTSSTAFGVTSRAIGESAFAAGTGAAATAANTFAVGTGAAASQAGALALGGGTNSAAANAVSIGTGATTTAAGGLALGAGSAATRAGLAGGAEAFTETPVASAQGAVSVGAAGAERQITNVAGGTQATDAVNVRQLQSVGTNLAGSLGGGAAFDPTTGTYTAPVFTTAAGTTANTVQAALGNETAAITSLGNGTATKLGGGVTYNAATGQLANGFTVNGTTYTDVASAVSGAAANNGLVQRTATPGQVAVTAPGGTGTAPGAAQVVTNVAAGTLAAGSTQAVNGGQLFGVSNNVDALGTTTAAAIGGNAAYTPGIGITGPTYTLNGAAAPFTNVVAGEQALANGAAGPVQYAVPGTPSNALNLVGTGAPVTLGNVAAGALTATSTDAVNGSQLYTTNQTIAGLTNGTAGLVQQNPVTRDITVGAGTDGTVVGFANNAGAARTLTGVAAGTVTATSTQGVNGSQLFGTAQSVANGLGGGSAVNPDGTVSAPAYTVGGQTYGNVGAALAAGNALSVQYTPDGTGAATNVIDLTKGGTLAPVGMTGLANATTATGAVTLGQSPLQYSTAAAPTTANPAVPSNDVTLVGANAGAPISLHNLAAGTLAAGSTDAVNGGQLFTTNQNIAALTNGTAGLVQQDPATRAISVGGGTDGTTVGFANNAGAARTLTGVAAGNVAAGSTEAINGGQLAGTAGSVATALGGGSTVNPDGTISAPTYNVANGSYNDVGSALTALDNGISSGKLGAFVANNTSNRPAPTATGADASAGGFGASATGANSTVLGGNATDNGSANATILGSNGSVTQAGGVALGFGSTATRAALAGANEAFSGTSVGSTQGAVSVGAVGAERQITNVAGGTQDTDAVNLRQLRAVGTNVATSLGGGAGFDAATGAYTAPTYTVGGQAYNDVGSALAAGNALSVQYTPNGAGGATNAIDLTKGGTLAPVTMSGLAAGALTATSTDAVNGSQLFATNQQLAAIAGGTAGLVQQDPTTRAITVGAGTDGTTVGFANNAGAARTLTGVAAGQVAAGSTQAVNGGQLAGTAGSVASALGGGAAVNPDGTVSAPTYAVGGTNYNNVGGAITALDSSGVKYDAAPGGGKGQSITLAGGDPNQPVVIHNVGAGVARTDAANYGQVQDAEARANAYTNQRVAGLESQVGGMNDRISGLQSDIQETKREARQGAAIGLAAASLRYDDRPGKVSVAAGAGYWRGEAAGAFGLGYTLPDGRFRINGTVATTGTAVGAGAGATYTFN